MMHGSGLEIYLEGILFPCRSFRLEMLDEVDTLIGTLVDFEGRDYRCFLERIESARLYFKDAACAVALSRLRLDNPDYDLAS